MNIYFQDIMERIRMHYKKMTNTERIIADFFLSNTEKMEFSAKAVAARSVSYTHLTLPTNSLV